jgi:hypothetical protein
MKTSLELATELDALLKRSKPFRNFQEVFGLTEQLIASLTPQPITKKSTPIVEEPVVIEDAVVEEVVETKTTKKTTKK